MPIRLIVWLLLCCTMPAIAAPEIAATPSRLQVSYDVIKDGIRGATMTEIYTRMHDGYHIESVSKAVGILALIKPETIRVVSEGTVTTKGLRPITFTNKRELDVERNVSANFDWEANRITLNDRNGKRTLPLPAGTQDRLSAMYQFMFLPLKNTALDFYMTNGSKVDIYNYLLTPNQSVTVPIGTFKALYVASLSKAGESRTEIWLATEHENFPYKMVITDPDGGKFTQVLTRFDFTP
jgi:hypothetical protein